MRLNSLPAGVRYSNITPWAPKTVRVTSSASASPPRNAICWKNCARSAGRGETISDLVREAIALLVKPGTTERPGTLSPAVRAQVERLAVLLKREPHQVEEACVEGILDLIERKCDVPLIVMETHLHLKYRGKDENGTLSWKDGTAPEPDAPRA